MKIARRKTKVIKIGNIAIGGTHPVAIQSMAKTRTADTEQTIAQVRQLENAGCEIVRLAIRDIQDARALKKIKPGIHIPVVADIHFSWQLAQEAIDNGADKIRLNPGNIYRREQIVQIAKAAKKAKIPIRVGLNSGSLPDYRLKNLGNLADRMVKGALSYIKILEDCDFYDLVISLKASNILDTIEAYRLMSNVCDYPLHLGVTATGGSFSGAIKSSIAVGCLLEEGIGDTIRVSLTAQPQEEVRVAKYILEALQLRHFSPQIISCPTCGRCEVDLVKMVKELETKLWTMDQRIWTRPMKLAVMGCVVNGPGEAKEADLGVAFGKRQGLFFKNGKALRKISFENCLDTLLKEMRRPTWKKP